MFLRKVEIRNFLSLENVTLSDLGGFNTLIGRNNVGKSAVFKAITHLGRVVHGHNLDRFDGDDGIAAVTGRDARRSLEFKLVFETRQSDREAFLELLPATAGNQQRRQRLLDGTFVRQVEYTFRSAPRAPHIVHLRETRVMAEGLEWALIQRMKKHDNEQTINPTSEVTSFVRVDGEHSLNPLTKQILDLDCPNCPHEDRQIPYNNLSSLFRGAPQFFWFQGRLTQWLSDCFSFSPFRHCKPKIPFQENQKLEQDGSNLAQVLATVLARDRRKFDAIERFLLGAAPELGTLQTPRIGGNDEIGFVSDAGLFTHLHEMGGGVEQLLMVATVLLTTPETSTLFLEEPESHLHPGALRFLLDQLASKGRQVFVTSHSPVLLNAVPQQKVFKVTYSDRRTNITPVKSDSLGELLGEIGARNSDVLLSDAVLFVEGPSDEETLLAWSDILLQPLGGRNVTILHMEGGQYAEQKGPPRADVLKHISEAAPVPHLFLFDRDERDQEELTRLAKLLEGHCHILARRELENYLLIPRRILEVLRSKCPKGDEREQKLKTATCEAIEDLVKQSILDHFGTVLLRRIRASVPGLRGGLIEKTEAEALVPLARDQGLAAALRAYLANRLKVYKEGIDLEAIVLNEKTELETEWKDPKRQLALVPGEEVLDKVFQHFGFTYAKTKDAAKIARMMKVEEIDEEIKCIVQKVVGLLGR
jgi:predicted ATPase